jgi:spermidine synthase
MGWFYEVINNLGITVKVKQKVFDYTGMQRIEIFDTELGKMLVLDGKIQLIESFEHFYHEMLVHVPMFSHPEPKNILIIGGGDGGAAREVLKHNPESVTMVEIDEDVVKASREYIGVDASAFNDSRFSLLFEDGVEYVKKTDEKFDIIIVDGTDPTPVSESLFSHEFYSKCSEITEYFVIQSQSPLLQPEDFKRVYSNLETFAFREVYLSFAPMYPGGLWSYILASNSEIIRRFDIINQRFNRKKIETRHYTPELHIASFTLPKWVKDLLH